MQIMDILVKQQVSGKPPDVQHTWFQIPVRFEDALGRVIPIPSEYNWSVRSINLLTVLALTFGRR